MACGPSFCTRTPWLCCPWPRETPSPEYYRQARAGKGGQPDHVGLRHGGHTEFRGPYPQPELLRGRVDLQIASSLKSAENPIGRAPADTERSDDVWCHCLTYPGEKL